MRARAAMNGSTVLRREQEFDDGDAVSITATSATRCDQPRCENRHLGLTDRTQRYANANDERTSEQNEVVSIWSGLSATEYNGFGLCCCAQTIRHEECLSVAGRRGLNWKRSEKECQSCERLSRGWPVVKRPGLPACRLKGLAG